MQLNTMKPYYTQRSMHELRISAEKGAIELKSVEQLKNTVVRVRQLSDGYEVGYFDKAGIFQVSRAKDAEEFAKEKELVYKPKGHASNFSKFYRPVLPKFISNIPINRNWIPRILNTMRPGEDKISDLVERYNYLADISNREKKTDININELYQKYKLYDVEVKSKTESVLYKSNISKEVRDFIYLVEKPIFERETENPNKNTFDFIRVRLSIPGRETMPDRVPFAKNHIKEIARIALTEIQDKKTFQKYGVPINILKLENVTITADSQLELLFGIKDLYKDKGVEEREMEEDREL